jgi:hypothetical protein
MPRRFLKDEEWLWICIFSELELVSNEKHKFREN